MNPNGRPPVHGHAKSTNKSESPTYGSWHAMIQRCTNEHATGYERYGGRGIKVCERWRRSFVDFLADMGERPVGMTLDRFPDKNGDYEPGNVRWATKSQQSRHRRSGSRSGKLEPHEPAQIRWLHDLGYSQRDISRFFSISDGMTSRIVNGKTWT